MKASKRLSMRMLLAGGVVVISVFYVSFVFHVDSKSEQDGSDALGNAVFYTYEKKQDQAEVGIPMRLRIPSIGVDAAIESEGLTPDGSMDIPESMESVGWFESGKRPGEIGSAVIAGHYGIKNGKASVFDDLHKLRNGDKIYVEDDNGEVVSFVVRESRRYDSSADTSDVFESDDGKAHLNIITCEGVWNKASKSYPTRLVVFADRE